MTYTPGQLLENTAHRPFPYPAGRGWIMAQAWQRLLFVHYPVDVAAIRPLIPPQLEIDTYEGQAWLGIVPFLMNRVHLRRLPSFPTTGRFPELNVRTYVRYGGKQGVWFFSLDAASLLAVRTARLTFHLPYFYARMSIEEDGDTIIYSSQRRRGEAAFEARYWPTAAVQAYAEGTLDRWLTDRYVLYAANRRGRIFEGHITHMPWPLQPAQAEIQRDTMAQAAGIATVDVPPLLHYVHHIDVIAWRIAPV